MNNGDEEMSKHSTQTLGNIISQPLVQLGARMSLGCSIGRENKEISKDFSCDVKKLLKVRGFPQLNDKTM